MAEIFKFFNSAPGDARWHTASDFADYFGSVLSSGVLPLNENFRPGQTVNMEYGLSVSADFNSMRTFFSTVGKALILGYSYEYTGGGKTFTHRYDDSLHDRIDRIVLRLDLRNQERSIKAFIKEGVADFDPHPPELTRNATIYELSLAQVRVRGGRPYISNNDIIDERANEDVCGIVQSLITVPTSVFQQQFDAWFESYKQSNQNSAENWLDDLKTQISRDTEIFVQQEILENSNTVAGQLIQKADEAKNTADATAQQLDNILREQGMSDAEVVAMRTNREIGTSYPTAGARADAEFKYLNNQNTLIRAEIERKLSGTVYVSDYEHLKNENDWSPVLQYIADNISQGEIILPNKRMELHSQVTFTTSNFRLRGQPNTKIVNLMNETVGTGKSLFYIAGGITELTTRVTNDVQIGKNQVYIGSVENLAIGDNVAFEGYYSTFNISTIEHIDYLNGIITLDRTIYYPILTNAKIYKINAVENVVITDLDIDFNSIYGYGVFVRYGKNVNIKNVTGLNVGSKLVQFNNCFDSKVENIKGTRGIDNFIAGHSYVVRFAVCNDCEGINVEGRNMRHVIDLSGASRNKFVNCAGYYNTSADFLTHGNHCYDNQFINCDSVGNPIAAYAFNPRATASADYDNPGFDRRNIVDGGMITESPIVYHNQDGSNIFKNLTIKINNPYVLRHGGKLTIENSVFYVDAALLTGSVAAWDLTFLSCRFMVNVPNGLGNMTNSSNTINVTFDNCDIECNQNGTVLTMPTTSALLFKNCHIKLADNTQNYAAFLSKGKVVSFGNIISFKTAGISIFGLQTGASLLIDKCYIARASEIIRVQNVNEVSLTLGNNSLINANYPNFETFGSVTTLGVIDINATSIPTSSKFTVGSRILNTNPQSGAADAWVYTGGGWKATSLIA